MNASIPGFAPEIPDCRQIKWRYFGTLSKLFQSSFVPAVV
jgi:hypothetical protein